jgi:hypothetical protein
MICSMLSHHAEGLVNPKVLAKKTVTDFGYPRVVMGSNNGLKIYQTTNNNFLPAFVRKYNAGLSFALLLLLFLFLGTH